MTKLTKKDYANLSYSDYKTLLLENRKLRRDHEKDIHRVKDKLIKYFDDKCDIHIIEQSFYEVFFKNEKPVKESQ